jgi:DNA-binding XRE family transcriptional regulator
MRAPPVSKEEEMLPDNTPHDVIRAVGLLERSGYHVSGRYDPHADNIGSWNDGIKAMRVKHRASVRSSLPELINYRNSRHLTQEQIAAAIGVSPSLFCSWEAGHRFPPADLFARWCALLGVE